MNISKNIILYSCSFFIEKYFDIFSQHVYVFMQVGIELSIYISASTKNVSRLSKLLATRNGLHRRVVIAKMNFSTLNYFTCSA